MSKETDSVVLKLTGAIVLDGQIVRAGTLVEVTQPEAKQLLQRGKAVLATERNAPANDEPEAKRKPASKRVQLADEAA